MAKRHKKTLREALQGKREQDRLENRRVAFIHAPPTYEQLREAVLAQCGFVFGLSALLAVGRHSYTNYDTLCDRAARVAIRNSMPRHLLQAIIQDYREQANALIKEAVTLPNGRAWR